jgi:hypothetical protein
MAMMIVVHADLTDAVHTTTDGRGQRSYAEIKSDEDCRKYRVRNPNTGSETSRWLGCQRPMVEGVGADDQSWCNRARLDGILDGRTAR